MCCPFFVNYIQPGQFLITKQKNMSKNLSDLSGRKGLEKNLFEELGKAAELTGTPGLNDMEKIREEFLFGKANVYGSVSFMISLNRKTKERKCMYVTAALA